MVKSFPSIYTGLDSIMTTTKKKEEEGGKEGRRKGRKKERRKREERRDGWGMATYSHAQCTLVGTHSQQTPRRNLFSRRLSSGQGAENILSACEAP